MIEAAPRNQFTVSIKNYDNPATTVPLVSVDLDHNSIVQLLRVYFSGKRLLPGVPLEIKVSSSGVGFHIKFFKRVTIEEDLKIRALLWDHADRLVYALKKWALNPAEQYVDLVFDEKNEGKERVLPLEQILTQNHSKEVKKINDLLNMGENGAADQQVKALAKKIEPEIKPYKKPSYVGCLTFKGDDLREDLEKCCTAIADKDQSFRWKVYPVWMPEWEWMLALFADDKDLLWKRLVWLKNNAYKTLEGDEKVLLLKDADTRMWIKERKST
jgi:hypothetical protein